MHQPNYQTSDQRGASPRQGGQPQPFILLHALSWRNELAAGFLIFVLLILLRFPVLRAFDTAFIGGVSGDAGLYVWLVKSNLRDLFTLPWFNTRAFYPYTGSLAWSDNFILPSLLTWPLQSIGLNLAASYNSVILLANFLNGFLTYLLVQILTGRPLVSLVAGCGFMSWSFLGAHLGHPQLQFAFWLPASQIFLIRFLTQPQVRSALAIGLCFTAAFLCAVYYAVFVAVLCALVLAAVLLLRPTRLKSRHYLRFSSGIILGLLPVFPFVWPYLAVLETFGGRNIYEAFYFSATPLSYLTASSWNWLYGWTAPWSHAEATLMPGLTTMALCSIGVYRLTDAKRLRTLRFALFAILIFLCGFSMLGDWWWRYGGALASWGLLGTAIAVLIKLGKMERKMGFEILTNRALFACFAFPALLAFLISLGPLGNPEDGQLALGVFRVFYEAFPGLSAIRAISRIGIIAAFCLFVLAGLSLSYLLERAKMRSYVVVLPLLLIIAENRNDRFPLESEVPPGPVFDYLHHLPHSEEAVLVLPWTARINERGQVRSWSDFARNNVQYMHWSFPLQRSVLNGYSGQRSKFMREFPRKFSGFPDQRSINTLRAVGGLRYIIYVSQFDPTFEKDSFFERMREFEDILKFHSADELGNFLFEVVGGVRLQPEFSLYVPSYPAGTLTLELLAPPTGVPGTQSVIDIMAPDHFAGAISSTIVQHNGEPAIFSFALPKTSDRVRPLRLQFLVRDNLPVFLQSHRYHP